MLESVGRLFMLVKMRAFSWILAFSFLFGTSLAATPAGEHAHCEKEDKKAKHKEVAGKAEHLGKRDAAPNDGESVILGHLFDDGPPPTELLNQLAEQW